MTQHIRLYYSSNNINFGDQLSRYLIKKITGLGIERAKDRTDNKLVAIGSLLTPRVLLSRSIVWGTGTLTSKSIRRWPKNLFPLNRCLSDFVSSIIKYHHKNSLFKAVRGPLTRDQIINFGYNCPEIYGDPAILLPRFYKSQSEKKFPIGLIVHHKHESNLDKSILSDFGIHAISIKRSTDKELEGFIDELNSCQCIYSTSLHGLITAIAYGIPCRWLKIQNSPIHHEENYKFNDFFLGVNTTPMSPLIIPTLSLTNLQKLSLHSTQIITIKANIQDNLINSFPFDLVANFSTS